MQVEHELDQRPLQPRAGAEQHREARAGHAGGALEVEDAERDAEIPVRLGREVERPAASPCVRTTTLSSADVPTGTLACGRLGTRSRMSRRFFSIPSSSASSALISSALLAAGVEQGGGVLAGALRLGDGLPAWLRSNFSDSTAGQDLPARLIELGQRGQRRLETGPAGEEALPGRLEIVAKESGVEHAWHSSGAHRGRRRLARPRHSTTLVR